MPISRFPFFNTSSYYNNYFNNYRKKSANSSYTGNLSKKIIENNSNANKKNNSKNDDLKQPCFFELFGLKLYFDDILLICLIFFLYDEGVKDDELFISLILLLLS